MNWLWLRIDALLTALAAPERLEQMREEIRRLRAQRDAADMVRELLAREIRQKADCCYPDPQREPDTSRCGTCWTCLQELRAEVTRQSEAAVIESTTLTTRRVTFLQQESDHE